MEPFDTADSLATPLNANPGADSLAREMQVTFDREELSSFFDSFSPLDNLLALLEEG